MIIIKQTGKNRNRFFFYCFAITTINPLNLIKNNMILNVLQTKVENHKKF